jgi:Protein-tyrosine-phosphatase
MINLMFVCYGNICRSTMAEFVMKDLVNKAGLFEKYHIASSGTSREEIGNDTHHGTKKILIEKNIPFQRRKAVQLVKEDYDKYDLLLVMDNNNMRNIGRIIGEDIGGKVKMLYEYAGEARSIADPWYTGNFEDTYEDILKACAGLLETLK